MVLITFYYGAAVRPIFNQLYRLGWKEGYGGCTTYLTSGEDEEVTFELCISCRETLSFFEL